MCASPGAVAGHRPAHFEQLLAVWPRHRKQQYGDAGKSAFTDRNRTLWAQYDAETANGLLDEIGLTQRDALGFRQLPDGRTLEIVAEVDGEAGDLVDALQLIAEMWRDIGVKLFVKPQDRAILRQRAYAGQTIMVASPGLDNAIPTPIMPPGELHRSGRTIIPGPNGASMRKRAARSANRWTCRKPNC
jgi:ABC-type transport system substrate-binding protein